MGATRWILAIAAAFGLGFLVGTGSRPDVAPAPAAASTGAGADAVPRVSPSPAVAPAPVAEATAGDGAGVEDPGAAVDGRDGLVLRFGDPRGGCGRARIVLEGETARLVPFGPWTWFDENGTKVREIVYGPDGERAPGSVERTWYESGTPAEENGYGSDGDLVLERHWFENGQLAWEARYRGGWRVGVRATFYESGQPKLRDEYDDLGRSVRKTEWHENGQLAARTDFDPEGHETGHFVRYYANGVKYAEGDFPSAAGDVTHWVYRDETGRKTREGDFYCPAPGKADRKHGIWTEYDPDGTVKSRVRWDRGKPVETLPPDGE